MSWLIGEVEMAEEPAWGFRRDALGIRAHGTDGYVEILP